MGDIQNRPFSKNYSGLINQSVIGIGIAVLCVSGHELMKRRRRGKAQLEPPPGLGSRESWEFGYLYQGRSWARYPSPPSPSGWPLSWVKQAIKFPEDRLLELRGLDATIYIRFLRGCFWFCIAHLLTTFPILFPIHVSFSDESVSSKSMTRASISSLVSTEKGLSLLWIHICLLFWLTLSWMGTLFWICNGTFKLRALSLDRTARHEASLLEHPDQDEDATTYYEHPHPMYNFRDVPTRTRDKPVKGLRLRTIMVSNVPHSLRNEKDLQEYFEYYMSRKLEKPSLAITGTQTTQPGFLNKSFAFLFNRAKRLPAHLPIKPLSSSKDEGSEDGHSKETKRKSNTKKKVLDTPMIERVVIARKMTELASLLERREEILVLLETAHIKLANKALLAVKAAMERQDADKPIAQLSSKSAELAKQRRSLKAAHVDPELGEPQEEGTVDEEERMEQLIQVLGQFVEEFGTQRPLTTRSKKAISRTSRIAFQKIRINPSAEDSDGSESPVANYPPASSTSHSSQGRNKTVWDALLSLPRTSLDAYQPLVNLSHLFRGKVVPSIDYYTAKLNLLTSLITENRSKAVTDYDPVSTAFVTFADPADARRACKYLAVHPNNPMACLVTMAPAYQDVDWIRVMKSTYKGEFIKDWVVNVGVWAFTLFWLFPVSLLVGLVSIQNISLFWPSLKTYLDHHEWQSEVLQSFIPTLLVALLALLIPLILLLIAKKAHTITTLSALHDRIMTRYYKFLIVNVLVFFCVGTAALQSFLNAFRSAGHVNLISVVATSFPTAGPFYVGWLIFTTAMHGGFELAMIGLPLILYPKTSRQVTPRKRTVGTRPRTFNFYYWLPNHTLVIHVLLLFSVLNPFVLPFGTLYFFIQSGVVKNQLIHVYAKNYEADGRVLMIRIVRYSLDGLILAQAVFLAYMVVLKKTANVGLSAFLIVFTAVVKLLMTRMCRAQYEVDDILEADIVCRGPHHRPASPADGEEEELIRTHQDSLTSGNVKQHMGRLSVLTWKIPAWVNFSYSTMNQRGHRHARPPNPFGPHRDKDASEEGYVHITKDGDVTDGMLTEPEFAGPSSPPRTKQNGYPWHLQESHGHSQQHDPGVLNVDARMVDASGPVVPHPPPRPWDDQTTIDLPYDNPFYTRMIDNVLWLPRDPTGILNLDDTVNLRMAIPVDVTAGRLGTWTGLNETTSPDEISDSPASDGNGEGGDATSQRLTVPRVNTAQMSVTQSEVRGTEDIELPSVIAKRVQAKESDVEPPLRTRKSSLFPRKASGSSLGMGGPMNLAMRGTPSINGDSPRLLSARTFSEGSGPVHPSGRARSGTMGTMGTMGTTGSLQVPSPSAIERARSDTEFGIRLVDAHAQADFVAANTSSSRLSLPLTPGQQYQRYTQQHQQQPTSVSAAKAIFHEVLEEERQALQHRIEEETAEATKGPSTKSWLTSWMFKKPHSTGTGGS